MESEIKQKLQEVKEWLQKEYSSIRTGQANPSLLDGIRVECYGSLSQLNQIGSVGSEDARTLRISPWDVSQTNAIEKAIRDAKKHMITISRTKENSIPHNTEAKYGSTEIQIRPAQGRGLVAGASVRTVLELGGVTDVTAKILSRSKNKTNIARAAVTALKKLEN